MQGEEITSIRNESLKLEKCETGESLKVEVTSLHETLEKLTKVKNKIYLILNNQRASYNGLGYKPNRSFGNMCHARKKSSRSTFKWIFFNKLGHFEPYYYAKCNYGTVDLDIL